MYNLVCKYLKCTLKDDCDKECENCSHTEDLVQCVYCRSYNECSYRSEFRKEWRSYYQHLGIHSHYQHSK